MRDHLVTPPNKRQRLTSVPSGGLKPVIIAIMQTTQPPGMAANIISITRLRGTRWMEHVAYIW